MTLLLSPPRRRFSCHRRFAASPVDACHLQFPCPISAMYQLEITHDLDSLFADPSLWNTLSRGVPFRETSWLEAWWRHFGDDKQPYVVLARDRQQQIRGILPLFRGQGSSGRRTLSMIGGGQACSDYASVLAQADEATDIADRMGRFLAEHAADSDLGWDMISIDGVVEGDRPFSALASALQESGVSLHAQSRMSTWFKPTDASWDAHLKNFGKTQRRKMRRWSERIDSTEGLEKVVAQSIEQTDDLLETLIQLHQRRWNADGQPGSFADPVFTEFVRQATRDFCRRGRLYLPTLTMDGRSIGSELHFVGGDGRLYCYSSGYDIDAAELEPGRILSASTLKHLYEAKLKGIDYLRGDEPYKKRMAATPARVFHFRAVAPTWLPRLRHAAWCTRFGLKQWMRRQTGRKPVEVADLTSL